MFLTNEEDVSVCFYLLFYQLKTELSALMVLSKCSITGLSPQSPFSLKYFWHAFFAHSIEFTDNIYQVYMYFEDMNLPSSHSTAFLLFILTQVLTVLSRLLSNL